MWSSFEINDAGGPSNFAIARYAVENVRGGAIRASFNLKCTLAESEDDIRRFMRVLQPKINQLASVTVSCTQVYFRLFVLDFLYANSLPHLEHLAVFVEVSPLATQDVPDMLFEEGVDIPGPTSPLPSLQMLSIAATASLSPHLLSTASCNLQPSLISNIQSLRCILTSMEDLSLWLASLPQLRELDLTINVTIEVSDLPFALSAGPFLRLLRLRGIDDDILVLASQLRAQVVLFDIDITANALRVFLPGDHVQALGAGCIRLIRSMHGATHAVQGHALLSTPDIIMSHASGILEIDERELHILAECGRRMPGVQTLHVYLHSAEPYLRSRHWVQCPSLKLLLVTGSYEALHAANVSVIVGWIEAYGAPSFLASDTPWQAYHNSPCLWFSQSSQDMTLPVRYS